MSVEDRNPGSLNVEEPSDSSVESFSVIGGGPLARWIQRIHLDSEDHGHLPRRMVVAFLLAWVPVAVLSIAGGRAFRGSVQIPFFFDIDVQARLLLALPVLLLAEVVAYQRLSHVVPAFLRRKIIPEGERPKFDAIVGSVRRLRNSGLVEALLLLFVYAVGVSYVWRTHLVMPGETWYAVQNGAGRRLTPAGWWYALVSLPLWQFLLIRWYYRLVLWGILLFRIARLKLHLVPTHPDRCGGLAFLTTVSRGFSLLLFVHGTLVAGTLANRIYYQGAKLAAYKFDIGVFVAIMLLLVLGPLTVFMPTLARLRRRGIAEYGGLATDYVRSFDQKWIRGVNPAEEPLLGTPDLQSLADLANSFQVVVHTQKVPFQRSLAVELAVASLLPIAPLLLTMIPLEKIAEGLLKMIF